MTVTALNTKTDYLAKTDSTSFPAAEKLEYYNESYGILNALIMDEQEDNFEIEKTKTTVADQPEYKEPARIHHINWLKIKYDTTNGFIPATYKPKEDLIREYGNSLESELENWSGDFPIYFYTGQHFFVYPAPDSDEAGANRLKISYAPLPADLSASDDEPTYVPVNFHYLLAEYAAFRYHDNNGEDSQAKKRESRFYTGADLMIATMFPRARQREHLVSIPDDDGSDY